MLNLMEGQLDKEGEDHKEDGKKQGGLHVRSNVRAAEIRL